MRKNLINQIWIFIHTKGKWAIGGCYQIVQAKIAQFPLLSTYEKIIYMD